MSSLHPVLLLALLAAGAAEPLRAGPIEAAPAAMATSTTLAQADAATAAPRNPAPGPTPASNRSAPSPPNGTLTPARPQPPQTVLRPQTVAPLPGGLDRVPMVNDNNPELIVRPGILVSSFDPSRGWNGTPLPQANAHLNSPLIGPFELFSHHVYAGQVETLDSTLWLAVVAAPRGDRPVRLRLRAGSTALSQSVDGKEPSAPFLPLPDLLNQGVTPIWSGPGSRVATELLRRERSPQLPPEWILPPGQLSTLLVLPIPVRGLDPLLNGRNLQLRLDSDAAVDVATLAAFGDPNQAPAAAVWAQLLRGDLSPREHAPSPKGSPGAIVYSRVSGIEQGSAWRGRITDPGQSSLAMSRAPISWPIASLERGSFGTGQVQAPPLSAFYPGTAWAAHGSYGVEYDLALPLRNDTSAPLTLQLALESPLKSDQAQGGLRFNAVPGKAVLFRGTVEVSGLDGTNGKPVGRQGFHLVLRAGQIGPALGTVTLAPGQRRQLQVRLIYPADATPPQVLSLLPVTPAAGPVKQSQSPPTVAP
ncbi:MAG: DUF3370 domain-containing protein [Cyanobium sp.]